MKKRQESFFGGVLGLDELPKPEELTKRGGVWFLIGDKQIHIGVHVCIMPDKNVLHLNVLSLWKMYMMNLWKD